MNKKVYYNSKFILLSTDNIQPAENQEIVNTDTSSKELVNEGIKKFIQQNDGPDLILICKDTDQLFEEIKTQFVHIEAAGGLIQQQEKYLFIFRLGKWDLPKGKLDKGETPAVAAIRECEEECGISRLTIEKQLPSTYHIYPFKGIHALKTTYWYLMKCDDTRELVPQTEENITKAEWLSTDAIKNTVLQNTYPSVADLISISIVN
jgi:8-oxo-dGTP pyrophosphatase MutT (NUDIX family)